MTFRAESNGRFVLRLRFEREHLHAQDCSACDPVFGCQRRGGIRGGQARISEDFLATLKTFRPPAEFPRGNFR